ncbi:MAG: endonuclease/exonuclease/phosphatase family protein [Candidatus Hodarchaeales archaeon]|jgi:hypothetical protein
MPEEYYLAWWNLENLFDVENSADRPEYLQKRLKNELEGWTREVLEKKIVQLTGIIKKMNEGNGPDLLGVCEVENKNVMKQLKNKLNEDGFLPDRSYDVAHHACKDKRGIDVGFIFDKSLFKKGKVFAYEVLKRSATRDIFQVNFTTEKSNKRNEIVVIGNHWPSRSGGVFKSEPYRIIAAETLSYWHSRIVEIKKNDEEKEVKDIAIIAMGDFNDEPFNRSLTGYALSTRSKRKVLVARTAPRLYNLMWPLMGQRLGTYYYDGVHNMLDQFLVSEGCLLDNSTFSVDENSVTIVSESMTGDHGKPVAFGRPSKRTRYNEEGFSDHFPISMIVREDETSQ